MDEALAKQVVNQQVLFIMRLLREIRTLIGSLESIESVMEDGVIRFNPLLQAVKDAVADLLESNQVEEERAAIIKEDMELFEEEIDEFERSKGVFAGLGRLPA